MLGGSRPEIRPRVVDLPHPVGPTTAANSPGATAMSRSLRAVWTPPLGVAKRLVTPLSSIAGSMKGDRTPSTTAKKTLVHLATTKATKVFLFVRVVPPTGAGVYDVLTRGGT